MPPEDKRAEEYNGLKQKPPDILRGLFKATLIPAIMIDEEVLARRLLLSTAARRKESVQTTPATSVISDLLPSR